MSLRVLQLKSRRFENPISSGGFSLNRRAGLSCGEGGGGATKSTMSSSVYINLRAKNQICSSEGSCSKNVCKTVGAGTNADYISQKTLNCDISGRNLDKLCDTKCKPYYIGGTKYYAQTKVNKIITSTMSEFIEKKHKKYAICISNNIGAHGEGGCWS